MGVGELGVRAERLLWGGGGNDGGGGEGVKGGGME